MKRFAPHLPYEDFPLFPVIDRKTNAGRWAKKIRQALHYFGSIADGWEKALERYNAAAPYVHAGRAVPDDPDGMTVARLCDHFYEAKRIRQAAGEITERTLSEYEATCKTIVSAFDGARMVTDITAADFAKLREKLTQRIGPVRLTNEVTRVRGVFKFGFDNGLIDKPMRYGSEFAKPSKKTLRLHRADQGEKLFAAKEIGQLIKAAGPQLRAMILLGINAGMGNADVAGLNTTHIDLPSGAMSYPRAKTGVERRAILWPATVKAIGQAMKARPQHKSADDADAVFITRYGGRWASGGQSTAIGHEFAKLLKAQKITRDGMSFYALRHTFRTVADAAGDQRAVDRIMGHESGHISTHYVERIDDARLRTVADHVHRWLFNKAMPKAKAGKAGAK